MGGITLELKRWPVVLTTIVGEVVEQELDAYLSDFTRLVLGKRLPFVSIVDVTRVYSVPSARVRQRVGAWQKENSDLGNRYSRGVVILTSSIIVRGAMTAINWVSPPRIPTVYEESLSAALEWARHRLSDVEEPPAPSRRAG